MLINGFIHQIRRNTRVINPKSGDKTTLLMVYDLEGKIEILKINHKRGTKQNPNPKILSLKARSKSNENFAISKTTRLQIEKATKRFTICLFLKRLKVEKLKRKILIIVIIDKVAVLIIIP